MTPNTATRTTNDLVDSLREASPRNSTQDRLLFLCACAANEIDRLQKVIDDYVRICKASAREIRRLRARPKTYAKNDGRRCVSNTDGGALTDAEREAVAWFTHGPSTMHALGWEARSATLRGLLERMK